MLIREANRSEVVEEHRFGRAIRAEERSLRVAGEARRKEWWQRASDLRAQRAWKHPLVHSPRPPVPRDARIFSVSGEQLVAAFSGQHHRDMTACEGRHEVQRNAGGMRDWLVLVPHELRQRAEEVALG